MVLLAIAALIPLAIMGSSSNIGVGIAAGIAIAFALFGLALIGMLAFADFLLVPLITTVAHISVQPYPEYRVTNGQNAVIKQVNGIFYATGYLTANLFSYSFKQESVPQEEDYRLSQAPETWERVVMNVGFPFKFHIISSGLDVQVTRDDLEALRSYQEFQLSKIRQGGGSEVESRIADVQRNISIIEARMNRLSAGEKPVSALMYLETTAAATTEKAALDSLNAQINRLQVAFSSMDISVTRIVGRELYTVFDMNFYLPTDHLVLEDVFDTQG